MVEQYVLPMVDNYVELKVLSYKLKASFFHIFVLFHNDPAVNDRINRRRSRSGSFDALFPDPLSPRLSKSSSRDPHSATRSPPTGRQRSPAISLGGPVSATTRTPPGLPIPTYPYMNGSAQSPPTATFLLPLRDYRKDALNAFNDANQLAERLLPGSHPIRLSVKVEFVAYLYDCLHEAEQSRKMARMSIRQVYEAQEGMDDESFEDAAEMVGILGRMMKRGLGQSGSGSQSGSGGATSRERVGNGRGQGVSGSDSHRPSRGHNRGGGGNRSSRGRETQPSTWV